MSFSTAVIQFQKNYLFVNITHPPHTLKSPITYRTAGNQHAFGG